MSAPTRRSVLDLNNPILKRVLDKMNHPVTDLAAQIIPQNNKANSSPLKKRRFSHEQENAALIGPLCQIATKNPITVNFLNYRTLEELPDVIGLKKLNLTGEEGEGQLYILEILKKKGELTQEILEDLHNLFSGNCLKLCRKVYQLVADMCRELPTKKWPMIITKECFLDFFKFCQSIDVKFQNLTLSSGIYIFNMCFHYVKKICQDLEKCGKNLNHKFLIAKNIEKTGLKSDENHIFNIVYTVRYVIFGKETMSEQLLFYIHSQKMTLFHFPPSDFEALYGLSTEYLSDKKFLIFFIQLMEYTSMDCLQKDFMLLKSQVQSKQTPPNSILVEFQNRIVTYCQTLFTEKQRQKEYIQYFNELMAYFFNVPFTESDFAMLADTLLGLRNMIYVWNFFKDSDLYLTLVEEIEGCREILTLEEEKKENPTMELDGEKPEPKIIKSTKATSYSGGLLQGERFFTHQEMTEELVMRLKDFQGSLSRQSFEKVILFMYKCWWFSVENALVLKVSRAERLLDWIAFEVLAQQEFVSNTERAFEEIKKRFQINEPWIAFDESRCKRLITLYVSTRRSANQSPSPQSPLSIAMV